MGQFTLTNTIQIPNIMTKPLRYFNALNFTKPTTLIVLILFFAGNMSSAQNNDSTIIIEKFLQLGAFDVMTPAFDTQKDLNGETWDDANLLSYNYVQLSNLHPAEGNEVAWKDKTFTWESAKAAKDGFVEVLKKTGNDKNTLAFLAFRVNAEMWMKASLVVNSHQMFEIYLDGEKIKSKTNTQSEDEDSGKASSELSLEKGTHLILIKTLKPKGSKGDWTLKAGLIPARSELKEMLSAGISPVEYMNIDHLLNGKFVNDAQVSPDGSMVLLKFSETTAPDGKKSSWAEVRELLTGKLVQSFRDAKVYSMQWLPVGTGLSYETSNDEAKSLWFFDLITMTQRPLLENVKDLGSCTWSPDGSFLIYTISEKPEGEKEDLKRYEGMPDRWPWWRSRSFLYKLDVRSGVSERLTYGHLSTNLHDISPDGNQILFSQSTPDFTQRPYSKQYLMEMDLQSYVVDTLWEKNFSGSCTYAPDGIHLLVTGSPAMFGRAGVNVTGEVVPNDYDTQAYIYNPDAGDVDPITFNFNPSINSAVWSKFDKNIIYFLCSDRTYKKLFSYDLNTRYFTEINSGFDVLNSISLASTSPMAVCTGSGISTPKYAASINLADGEIKTIANPRESIYKNVEFGETAEWTFTNKNGVEIDGRIYFPPNFDKKKKYPLIVYYYGGTSPTERSFGGRYPKNLFAARGYVVYNLQPSGATGYGQDFSAAHVNNWGITVADEIIDGTKQFLDEYDFIDANSVGCIGASYGGFMTMLLQTRTDIFAAAISHAGISSISSYWGEGYWGYLYSSVASANSFPWNNPNLYIGQSALFNADKITTPLLLLHGGSDTNVPIGESIQLYTALKLLGRPVELIEVSGQDHHIVDYKKRIEWQNTIAAWFDKWLKDQPDWWNEMYPERNL